MSEPEPEHAIMSLSIRLSIFYASLCLFSGVQLPFFPVWLKSKGLGPQEISFIIAATMFLRIAAAPIFAFVADRLDDRRRVVISLAWVSLLTVCLYLVTSGFWQIFLVTLVLMSLWPSISPLIDTIAMKAARDQGVDYGRVRLWCSITFIAGSSGTGWLLGFSQPSIIAFCLIGAIAVNLMGAYLLAPELPSRKGPPRSGMLLKGTLDIVRQPVFMLGITVASIIQSGHAVYYAFGTLNWQKLGYSDSTIGALWGVGIVAEIMLFAFSGPVIARFGATRLLTVGAAAAVFRWGITALSPPLWILFPLQTLHALTYCAAHLGALHFITIATPRSLAATGQSLYASLSAGVIMGGMTLAAGALYQTYGPHAYFLSAGAGVVAFFGTLMLGARWSGGTLLDDEGEDDGHRSHSNGNGAGC
ncbi:MAG TPA: MFS transporter [Parvibaculum sp.]